MPDLVIGIAERVLGQVKLDGEGIEQLVKSMIAEFADEGEKLEVFLNGRDLDLLKGLRRTVDDSDSSSDQDDEGFASAIAGIFDGLDGDDALLSEYPEVKFFLQITHWKVEIVKLRVDLVYWTAEFQRS